MRIEYKSGDKIRECIYINEEPTRKWVRRATFKCRCGRYFVGIITDIKRGQTVSCGCIKKKILENQIAANTIHGQSHLLSEYGIWSKMIARYTNNKNKAYPNYGGRGIAVCIRWLNSFENFLVDIGKRPSSKYSIERIDNNGNYESSNCKWATPKEQTRNKRNNVKITYLGEELCITDWAEKTGIHRKTLRRRLNVMNWGIEKSLTTPAIMGNNQFSKL